MVDNISSNRTDFRGETPSSQRIKPNQPPRNENFRKAYKDGRPPKEEEEEFASVGEKEDRTPSLFDLSKKSSARGKSPASRQSALKDLSSDGQSRPLSSKKGAFEQELDLGSEGEGAETASADTDIPRKPMGELFAANEEVPTDQGEALMTASPQEETPLPQQQMPGDVKKPQDQARLAEAMSRQQEAGIQHAQKSKKSEGLSFETKDSEVGSKKDKSKGEARAQTAGQEQAGVAGVNSSIQATAFHAEKAQEAQETARSATVTELANQIIERIQVMRKEDQTSTMITLRHPPILEGATITLTTSDHAKREFNISFANLSPDAKLFLDRKLNEDSLTQTLERKGLVVHMVSTTTQAENLINVDAGQTFRDRQDQQQEQQQQQQRRQQFQEEEETG